MYIYVYCDPTTSGVTNITNTSIPIPDRGDWVEVVVSGGHAVVKQRDVWALTVSGNNIEINLDRAKEIKITDLSFQIKDFVEIRYPAHRQRTLTLLLIQGVAGGLVNRIAYIQPVMDWMQTLITYFYAQRDQILLMTALAEIEVYEPDLVSFANTDPQISIEGAASILN